MTRRLPTSAELSILRVLWSRGPSTVHDVHDAVGGATAYTTTLKLLQMMLAKGLVHRDDTARQHIYRAGVTEATTLRAVVGQFVDTVFDGSAVQLTMQALGDSRVGPGELAALRKWVGQLERKRNAEGDE